jgi:hypothetical protein
VEVEEAAGTIPSPARSRPGAPIGNTNAVKHGLRSRTRGQLLQLGAMIQQAHPEWLRDPKQMPVELAAVLLALLERDNSIQEATTRRNSPEIILNQGVREATRQIQDRLAAIRSHPGPEDSKTDNQQPSTPAGN